jgi:uncharacterized protein YukJ
MKIMETMDTNYGVLKCKIVETTQIKGENPHFHIHTIADGVHFRVAINLKSEIYPYDVLYSIDYDFQNVLTTKLSNVPLGFYAIGPNVKEEYGLDYIRGNLFDIKNMKPLSHALPGPDNDLNEKIRDITDKSIQNQEAVLYAFGKRWGPMGDEDKYFHFTPSDGIHFVHMNQDMVQCKEDIPNSWQDGGLLVNFLPEDKWAAIFLAFQARWYGNEDTDHI